MTRYRPSVQGRRLLLLSRSPVRSSDVAAIANRRFTSSCPGFKKRTVWWASHPKTGHRTPTLQSRTSICPYGTARELPIAATAAYGGGACLDVSAGANHKRSVQTGPDRPTWFYIRYILTLDAGESKTGGGLDYECALDPRADPGLVAVRDLDRCEGAGGVAGVSTIAAGPLAQFAWGWW